MATSELLTMVEVSARLRVPVNTLRQWRKTKYGPRGALIGRRVMYREDDVQRWLDTKFGGVDSGETGRDGADDTRGREARPRRGETERS